MTAFRPWPPSQAKRPGPRPSRHVLLLILGLGGSTAGLEAQGSPTWTVRLEAARTEIHRAPSTGGLLGAVVGRRIGDGRLRMEVALAGGSADEGFMLLSAGPELRLFPHSRITPVGAVRVGLLAEPEYFGAAASVAAGLLVRPATGLALRGAVTRGTHGGQPGPHAIVLGVEVSLDRT